MKHSRFSTNIWLHLGDNTRYTNNYYRTLLKIFIHHIRIEYHKYDQSDRVVADDLE